MPVTEGVEATGLTREQHPEVAVIILSSFCDDSHLLLALEHGARGYVLKDTSVSTMVSSMLAIEMPHTHSQTVRLDPAREI